MKSSHLYEARGSRKKAKTLEGVNEIPLSLPYGICDGEIEECFWREGMEQKTQDAKVRIGLLNLFNSLGRPLSVPA